MDNWVGRAEASFVKRLLVHGYGKVRPEGVSLLSRPNMGNSGFREYWFQDEDSGRVIFNVDARRLHAHIKNILKRNWERDMQSPEMLQILAETVCQGKVC